MEKKEKNKKKNLTLPNELIVEILLRLPVRSLLRFRRVSPLWSSLISDPQFAKSHFDSDVAPTHRLLLRFLDEGQVKSFDLESPLDDRSAVKTINLPPPSMGCECDDCDRNPVHFLGSCRGFMLFAYEHTGDVIVWNPSTNFHQQILDLESKFLLNLDHLCGFGYDKSTDDYIVVVVAMYSPQTEIRSFSLKTKAWCDTKYVNVRYMDIGNFRARPGVFLNDSLHWRVTSIESRLEIVIAFDLVEKSLSDIPLSSELAAEFLEKMYYVRVLGGCLSLCYAGSDGRRERAEIWIMKEYKVQSSWTKVFVTTVCDISRRRFYPLCLKEGGRVIGSNGHGRLLKFNAKGKLLERLKYGGERRHPHKFFEMYRESLLFFPGEQRLLCVSEDEESEDAEEYSSDEEYYSSDEEYSSDKEYSSDDEYSSEDEDEEVTEDEDATEEEETTDNEEES